MNRTHKQLLEELGLTRGELDHFLVGGVAGVLEPKGPGRNRTYNDVHFARLKIGSALNKRLKFTTRQMIWALNLMSAADLKRAGEGNQPQVSIILAGSSATDLSLVQLIDRGQPHSWFVAAQVAKWPFVSVIHLEYIVLGERHE